MKILIQHYRNLPDRYKKLIYPFVLPFKILADIVREISFDAYILCERSSDISNDNINSDTNSNMIGVYITSADIIPYFVENFCGNTDTIKIKRIYIWELVKFVKEYDNEENIILVDIHKCFVRLFEDGFLVPPWIRQVMDLDKPIDKLLKKKEFKKARKFHCEVLKDLYNLKYFYENMYVPYIKRRHTDSAYIESFEYLERILKRGELLFIKLGDQYVAAGLYEIIDDTYVFSKVGVLDDFFVKEGALLATYYFGILRAKDINAKIVDLGQSRPLLSDGVLRHKRQMGARICEDKMVNRMFYLKNVYRNPFICIEDEKLKAVVFSDKDKFIAEHSMSGLEFKIIDDNNVNKSNEKG